MSREWKTTMLEGPVTEAEKAKAEMERVKLAVLRAERFGPDDQKMTTRDVETWLKGRDDAVRSICREMGWNLAAWSVRRGQ